MPGYRIISTDSHLLDPPDLWTSRIERKFGDWATAETLLSLPARHPGMKTY